MFLFTASIHEMMRRGCCGKGDRQFKVEVDAATGKIIEVPVEQWQIGDERNEDLGSNGESTNMEDGSSIDSNDESSHYGRANESGNSSS